MSSLYLTGRLEHRIQAAHSARRSAHPFSDSAVAGGCVPCPDRRERRACGRLPARTGGSSCHTDRRASTRAPGRACPALPGARAGAVTPVEVTCSPPVTRTRRRGGRRGGGTAGGRPSPATVATCPARKSPAPAPAPTPLSAQPPLVRRTARPGDRPYLHVPISCPTMANEATQQPSTSHSMWKTELALRQMN